MQADAPRFRAFISYSHRDKAVAASLHRALEGYRVPAKLVGRDTAVGPVPRRLTPIFRDRDELPASGDLGREINAALEGSQFLIVVCSPAAAASRWVDQEILAFKRLHGDDRVLALIAGGEPFVAGSGRDDECFPPALRFRLDADGMLSSVPAEPIAADLRAGSDGKRLAKLKLVAGLTGLRLDDLARRETQRRMRQLTAVAIGALLGMAFAVGLALYANAQRLAANEQRRIAEQESATARAASDFLVGTFSLSDAATENPRTITALTILDRSVARARRDLASQPAVQSRLLAALGGAYNNLGLYREATGAIEPSLANVYGAGVDGAEAQLALAETYLQTGRLNDALRMVVLTNRALDKSGSRLAVRAKSAVTEGRIWAAKADAVKGVRAFDRAIALYRRMPEVKPGTIATVLNNRGVLLSDDGQFDAAEESLGAALAINRRLLGDAHLITGRSWFALAQNAFLANKLPLAERRISRALTVMRRMLDPDNPTIADALSMQGQIFHGQGKLDAASKALESAVVIYRARFDGLHYLIGIADVYLALIESERGNTDAALRFLDDAKLNYDASYGALHANHGDLLVNRAVVLAKAGRVPEARAECADGIAILNQTLGPTAGFTRQLAATCAKFAA